MPNYFTCFLHPVEVRTENARTDPCPECGRPYDFPLTERPPAIRDFTVIQDLGRGFYGATFLVESGNLQTREVLKIVPSAVYEFFGKDFPTECRLHQEVADATEHLVAIRDYFEEDISFGTVTIPCHVAVLEYVPGLSLAEFLADDKEFTGRAAAQAAIDLLRLLQELENKGYYHNDLHEDNVRIRKLAPGGRRAEAVDESIRAVAIDLGSLADASKSNPNPDAQRLGDLHEVAAHLLTMSERLLRDPDVVDDMEYRLANSLREIGLLLSPDPLRARISLADCEQMINDAALFSISPWAPPGEMKRFNDAFNAETMHPYFVPRLLVDPDQEWLARLSKPMPTIISGMRGCGKTMLLRALQFHARASAHDDDAPGAARARVGTDDYVGLYVSCNRLLDGLGSPGDTLHEPYARLFVAYAREAVQAARHLRELDRKAVGSGHHRLIAEVVAAHLDGSEDLAGIVSEAALERALQQQLVSLAKGETTHSLKANPAVAFPQLAEAVRRCSPVWERSAVLFLLDDVSTRHLHEENIEALISSLMFKNETCAFKLTTETQVLELLLSPGLVERLSFGRDVDAFDLGGEVNDYLRERGAGQAFISQILTKRANQLRGHPSRTPEELLGNATLKSIAEQIASGRPRRRERVGAYHGISALRAICVGDIGDVISLYELMLRRWDRKTVPISPFDQSACYQNYGVRKLYHLNRRDPWLRDIALSFAQASNKLLTHSHKKLEERGKGRLRQYTTMHINVAGANEETLDKLKELIADSVFVFERGPDTPRLKSDDADPITQYILTFRKFYGVSSYIGLAERDRFELSAQDLANWFANPTDETILTSKLGGAPWQLHGPLEDEQDDEQEDGDNGDTTDAGALFLDFESAETPAQPDNSEASADAADALERAFVDGLVSSSKAVTAHELSAAGIATVVAGCGFEERSKASANEVFSAVHPLRAVLVAYQEEGFRKEIETAARNSAREVDIRDYGELDGGIDLPEGPVLVDVTGLPKPLIFSAVREALRRDGTVYVTHTQAETHYPLNEQIEEKLRNGDFNGSPHKVLEAARTEIFSGDVTPYSYQALLPGMPDDARPLLLCAGASAKHERLLSMLDHRQYDHLEIFVPSNDSARSWLACQAAEVALSETGGRPTPVDSDDLTAMLEFIAKRYRGWYGAGGFDVELGLTGSKVQAVAAAVLSATLKIAQCWYVKPAGFDPERFSSGVRATRHFRVTLPPTQTK